MLIPLDAEMIICKGACLIEGVISQAPHTSSRYIRYNGTASIGEGQIIHDSASKPLKFKDSMSLALNTAVECVSPWEILERPVIASPFGPQPNTITLDHWISLGGYHMESVDAADSDRDSDSVSGVQPRRMEFYDILNRLNVLQHSEVGEDVSLGLSSYRILQLTRPKALLREHYLYTILLRDSAKSIAKYDMDMEKEIATLTSVLNLPIWIDFTKAEAQLVVTYFENQDPETASLFFQQLLLSMELYLRIRDEICDQELKVQILSRLPSRVAWSIAMAQIWMSKVILERFEEGHSVLPFRVRILDTDLPKGKLINLAHLLKWPNTAAVEIAVRNTGNDVMSAEDTHPAIMSYLSGVVLPGAFASWLVMQCLIDCDENARDKLMSVKALHPNFGFQYRGATYWYWQCIIGKVLGAAKGAVQVAGWVCPGYHTDDLESTQAILVHQACTSLPVGTRQVKSMARRSDPLGPLDVSYPVSEYLLVLPTSLNEVADTIRMQKLVFKAAHDLLECTSRELDTYHVAVIFTIDGRSKAIRLAYDVSFISAGSCKLGPHVLFYDYKYLAVPINRLLRLKPWGPFNADKSSSEFIDCEGVIVIEAFGLPDNEVLARSWCSNQGFSAVVADISETCMACSIRQAYALCLSVVILTCRQGDQRDAAVDPCPCCRLEKTVL